MIEWLLDLDSLRFGDENVQLGWARPFAGWVWLLVVGAVIALSVYGYQRLEGARVWRIGLAFARAALLLLLVALISGPRLVKNNETEERDWVLMLVDRSASLRISDVTPELGGKRTSRNEQLKELIASHHDLWRTLGRDREIVWLGFDSTTHDLDTMDQGGVFGIDLGPADGTHTSIGRALEEGLRRVAARPLSGIVILSDGRSSDEVPTNVLQRLKRERVPVFTIALGNEDAVADLAIRSAEAPRVAFTEDIVPIDVTLERLGDSDRPTRVQLIDRDTGLVLDEQDANWSAEPDRDGNATTSVTLTTRPEVAGEARWSVRIVDDGTDLIPENNTTEFDLDLVDRPMRVVYFDGYPRWEQRFIKHLLDREESLESSVVLLSPNRRYLQEGDVVIDVLPTSPEEWAVFDTVILGDLRAGLFTREQLEQLRDHVGTRGGGLIWIAGEGATPTSWRGTPMADLLPFTVANDARLRAWPVDVTMETTPAADRLGVLRLASEAEDGSWWPRQLKDPATGWSRLRYAQRIEQSSLKPTAEVLAVARPVFSDEDPTPLVVSMRYGAGRVLYIATDETWRWRYGRGEYYPERFWLQMMRLLARERLSRSGKSAVLTASPYRAQVEQPVRIALELIDQRLLDSPPSRVRVKVKRVGAPGGRGNSDDRLADPDDPGIVLELRNESDGTSQRSGSFAATWLPLESGRYDVEVLDPIPGVVGLRAEVDVWRTDDEFRHPETDHVRLASLSETTDGAALTARSIPELPDLLPNRRLRLMGTPEVDDLWDTPLALLLIVLLLTVEWVGRRMMRLA